MGHCFEACAGIEFIDLIGVCRAIGNDSPQANFVIFGLGLDGSHDSIHGKDGVEIVCCNDEAVIGVLKGCGKSSTHHIPKNVKDHHVGVFQEVMLLEQLHGLSGDIAPAACSRWGAAAFNAHHAVVAGEHEVVGP